MIPKATAVRIGCPKFGLSRPKPGICRYPPMIFRSVRTTCRVQPAALHSRRHQFLRSQGDSFFQFPVKSYPLDSTDRFSTIHKVEPLSTGLYRPQIWTFPTKNGLSPGFYRRCTKRKTKRFSNSSVGRVQVDRLEKLRQSQPTFENQNRGDPWVMSTSSS